MAEISITTKLEELKVLFNQMKEVYYVSKVNSDLATLAAFDMELPVLSDGVTFDTGVSSVSNQRSLISEKACLFASLSRSQSRSCSFSSSEASPRKYFSTISFIFYYIFYYILYTYHKTKGNIPTPN